MTVAIDTKARAACRPGTALKVAAACLLCPLAALCRTRHTRAALGELDERGLKDIGLSGGDIDFIAATTASDIGRPAASA